MRTASRSDWPTKEMPSRRSTIALERTFSSEEIHRIQAGLVPEEMEDRWFIYWEDGTLFFHRSWTGFCVFIVRFAAARDGCRMVQADLNRDPEQYTEVNDSRDARMISYLIDALLLQRDADLPSDAPD
jgi:hypothetical protein